MTTITTGTTVQTGFSVEADTSGKFEIVAPNGVVMPSWTTANRPSTPSNKTFGVNTTLNVLEMYYNNNWVTVQSLSGIQATGGTITTSGNYRIHTFLSSGTFSVTGIPVGGNTSVSSMVCLMDIFGKQHNLGNA